MGSVTSYIDCPNCNRYGAHCDCYYKSGDTYVFCSVCGFSEHVYLDADADGKFKKNEKGEYIQLDVKEVRDGALYYKLKDSIGACIGAWKGDAQLQEFIKSVSTDKEIESAKYTKNIDGVWYRFDILSGAKVEVQKITEETENESPW